MSQLTTTHLLKRIDYLTTIISTRFVKATSESNPQHTAVADPDPFHPYLETASGEMGIESHARMIIRACEELVCVSEGLRGLWILGAEQTDDGEERDEKIRELEGRVRRGMEAWRPT